MSLVNFSLGYVADGGLGLTALELPWSDGLHVMGPCPYRRRHTKRAGLGFGGTLSDGLASGVGN